MIKLTDQEIKRIAFEIGAPTFNFMKKLLNKKMDEIKRKSKSNEIDINHVVNLVIVALASIDSSVLVMTRDTYKGATGHEMDFVKMMNVYFQDLMSILNADERERLKEKMN